jgi:periplasmic protein TonB
MGLAHLIVNIPYMEASKILSADLLDILFEGMNKEYGAYELRKQYTKRLRQALLVTGIAALLLTAGLYASALLAKYRASHQPVVAEVNLTALKEKPLPAPVIPIPPIKVTPPKIEIAKFTPPKIVDKPDVKNEVKKQDDLDNTTIGPIDQVGIKSPDAVNPPKVDVDSKVVAAPSDDADKVFVKVEQDAEFPGGNNAWHDYVQKTISSHMDELTDDGKSGSCEVQFIVDRDGVVSDVTALTMQGTKLAEVAVNAIRRGPHWKPAMQNGRQVKAFRRQAIRFEMPDQ